MKEQESIVQKLHKAFAKQTGVSLLASFEVLSTIKKNGNFDGINGFSVQTVIIKFHDTQKIKLYDLLANYGKTTIVDIIESIPEGSTDTDYLFKQNLVFAAITVLTDTLFENVI